MRCYPYFGSRREHQVHQPVYAPSPEWVMNYIHAEHISVVVAERVMSPDAWRRYAAFDVCPSRDPKQFRLLYEGQVVLYGVVSEAPASPNDDGSGRSP